MKKFKAGPVEAEFELATKQALAEASEARTSTQTPTATEAPVEKPSQKIVTELLNARANPSGAILQGWGSIDGELFRLGLQLGLCDDPLENTGKVYSKIVEKLPPEIATVVRSLRELRNQVAHVKVIPTAEAAQDYLAAVENVSEAILAYRRGLPSYKSDSKI